MAAWIVEEEDSLLLIVRSPTLAKESRQTMEMS